MKTVTGKLVSTKPISLSNAAKYISRFNSSENGVSTAVAVYLQRTSDAFNGLVQFHKKLKGSHSIRDEEQVPQAIGIDAKIEQSAAGSVQKEKKKKSGKTGEDEDRLRRGLEGGKADEEVFDTTGKKIKQEIMEVEGDMKKEKKKKRKNNEKEAAGDGKVDGGDQSEHTGKKNGRQNGGSDQIKPEPFEDGSIHGVEGGIAVQKRDEKKKRKENEGDERFGSSMNKESEVDGINSSKQHNIEVKEETDRVAGGSVELSEMKTKKKKKKDNDDEEVERNVGGEEGKKRKSREVDGEETFDSAEQSGKKKKKKRRIE